MDSSSLTALSKEEQNRRLAAAMAVAVVLTEEKPAKVLFSPYEKDSAWRLLGRHRQFALRKNTR